LGSYTRALLVSQDRRHLLVSPWIVGRKLEQEDSVNPKNLTVSDAHDSLAAVDGAEGDSQDVVLHHDVPEFVQTIFSTTTAKTT
jgi:hypothetical protein